MRLYVDFDDVLCQTALGLMERANAQFGKQIRFEQIQSFDLERSFGLTRPQLEWLNRRFHDPEVLLAFEPIPGCASVLHGWRRQGGEIDIVTGRPPATLGPSIEWLARYDVPFDRILFVDKYARGYPPVDGATVVGMDEIARMPYRAAVDDSAEMAAFLAGAAGYRLLLMDRPWNRLLSRSVERRVQRMLDWTSVADVLDIEKEIG